MDLELCSLNIEVQPELAEAILNKKMGKEYFCWLIIKAIDKKVSDNGGKINKQKLIKMLLEITNRSRFSISRYINNGENIFWRFDKNDDNVLYLNSFCKVCSLFGIDFIYSNNVVYNLSLILEDFNICNKLLLSAVASKKNSPVSNINLSSRCNLCKTTVKSYLNEAQDYGIIAKMNNFEILYEDNSLNDINDKLEQLVKNDNLNRNGIIIRGYNSKYLLLKQIPNSIISKSYRSSIKKYRKKINKKSNKKTEKHDVIYAKEDSNDYKLKYFCTLYEKEKELYDTGEGNINIFIRRSI